MKTEITCPLGHQCEEARDGTLYRCAWYVEIEGKNPQSEEYIREWRCAIAWQPILSVEIAQTNRGQTQAIESFRNETIKQTMATQAIMVETTRAALTKDEPKLIE